MIYFPLMLGIVSDICLGTILTFLFTGLRRWEEMPQNHAFRHTLMLIQELEQNALLLYNH
jgi:hypothetical protein